MRARHQLAGQRFDRLVAIERDDTDPRHPRWICRCDCGEMTAVQATGLLARTTRSCGCLRREMTSARSLTHGQTGSPEYTCWQRLRVRCERPSSPDYRNYGARGIKVCARWGSFENFLADMGPRPSAAHSIDRVDNDGDYGPENCRWTTRLVQNRNTRVNVRYEFNGRSLTVGEWAEELGVTTRLLKARIYAGWPIAEALSTPRLRRR